MDRLRGPVVLLAVAGLLALIGVSASSESVRSACLGTAGPVAFLGGLFLIVRLIRQ